MPATKSAEFSLLDTADHKVREWYVCYFHRTPFFFWAKWLKPGFRHVELARPVQYGAGPEDVVWLHVLPTFETLDVEVSFDPRPPWVRFPAGGVTIQKVTAVRPKDKLRCWFEIGPPSCVEVVKNALGISAFRVRTPWQLYSYIEQRNRIIK